MQENEISLKELILILLKGWKWIVGTTVVSMLISLLILVSMNTTTYQLNLTGTIIKADNYDTAFGVYPAYMVKNVDLINLVKSREYLKIITIEGKPFTITPTLSDAGEITISLNSYDPSFLTEASTSILENFENYVNYTLQNKAIEYFMDIHQISLDRTVVTVENNTKLIETLTQKLNSIDRLIAPDIINPEFNVFSSQRASIEFETIRLQYEIERNKTNLVQLEKLISKDFDAYKVQKEQLDVIKASINFDSSNNVQELNRFNPLTLLPISIILGGMLGVFIVFFLHYWKNN